MKQDKEWFESKTIWGALVAIAASFSGALGLSLDLGTQNEMAEALVQLFGAAGALVAIYGRLTATRKIS